MIRIMRYTGDSSEAPEYAVYVPTGMRAKRGHYYIYEGYDPLNPQYYRGFERCSARWANTNYAALVTLPGGFKDAEDWIMNEVEKEETYWVGEDKGDWAGRD